MATTNDKAARTIEDIERRQLEVHAIELAAVRTFVNVLRELAIALPPESKFPYDLADSAKQLEKEVVRFEREPDQSPHVAASNELRQMGLQIVEEMRRWRPEEDR